MFEKLKKIFKNRDEKEKHNYDLTFDNVAIPEVHVKSTESHEDADKENAPISYDNVAIPEVHISIQEFEIAMKKAGMNQPVSK